MSSFNNSGIKQGFKNRGLKIISAQGKRDVHPAVYMLKFFHFRT